MLDSLTPARGNVKNGRRKRVGRGVGSGNGKTAGSGHKGQLARSGNGKGRGFEGGQMPLQRRLPKRGFFNKHAEEIAVVTTRDLSLLTEDNITIETLHKANVISKNFKKAKVILKGSLEKKLNVSLHKFSKGAAEAIRAAGGSAEIVS